jgi:uncharacterized membrane protein YbhN (UPF0104 family)
VNDSLAEIRGDCVAEDEPDAISSLGRHDRESTLLLLESRVSALVAATRDTAVTRTAVMRQRLVQIALLVVGLAGIAFVTADTWHSAQKHVVPGPVALTAGALAALISIAASSQAWVELFHDVVTGRSRRAMLRDTYLLSQLTKYLPAGGAVQAASQIGLARNAGLPLRRTAVALPVTVVGAVSASATLAVGLVAVDSVAPWIRVLSLLGLASLLLLNRRILVRAVEVARRRIKRLPSSDELPTQRGIIAFYGYAIVTIGALCLAYTVLLRSLTNAASPYHMFCAFALSWVVGFLVIPIPAGVGIREAVLVALLPGVAAAPLLAASLALRLLTIGTEVVAYFANKAMTTRLHRTERGVETAAPQTEAPTH